MKEKILFTIEEIITIIMNMVQDIEVKELYGQEIEDEFYLPQPIMEKLNKLEEEYYKTFLDTASNITEEVYEYRSGELNELNAMHQEIKILANDKLKQYIDLYK